MDKLSTTGFELEWVTLQNQYDSYEKHSLFIKLFSVALCALLVFHEKLDFVLVILLLLCWLLDGIWKTFQTRISVRLVKLEHGIASQQSAGAMQFHTDWAASRPGAIQLALEYVKNSLAPTVLLPHAILLFTSVLIAFAI